MFFVRSREKYLIFFASFCFFSLQIFRFQPKRNQYTYFRFVSLPKMLCFADDFLRFALKRNEINIFWLLFTSLGTDLKIERQTLIFFFVSLQIVPEFHFILFRFEVFTSFSVFFASFKNFASVSLRSALK